MTSAMPLVLHGGSGVLTDEADGGQNRLRVRTLSKERALYGCV